LIESIKGINDTSITFYLRPNDLTIDNAFLNPRSSEYSNISCRPKLILEYEDSPSSFTLSSNVDILDTDGIFTLFWTSSKYTNTYSLYQNGTLLDSGITALSYYMDDYSNGSYNFKVIAFNDFGNITSNEITVIVEIPPIQIPDPPSSFTLTSTANIPDTNGIFTLYWTSSEYANNYTVYQNDVLLDSGITEKYYYIEIYLNGSYDFKAIAFNDIGNATSNEITVIIVIPSIPIPPEPEPIIKPEPVVIVLWGLVCLLFIPLAIYFIAIKWLKRRTWDIEPIKP